MAEYHITEKDSGVSVEVTDVGGHVDELMDAFAECQAGRCTCPTEEYRKLASLEVGAADDRGDARARGETGRDLRHR